MNVSNDLKTALMSVFAPTVDVSVYTGSTPASANVAATGTLLVKFTGVSLNASTSLSLVSTVNANAVASGAAGYARIDFGPGYNHIMDLPVGSGFTLSPSSLTNGQAVQLQTLNITL